ncbi:MAG: hypothetical protein M1832_003077 [Thelocarpon impressellum]|nr:MAG: hypothetical protein M1832_003077 [Thelocarpon impressellum]
MVGQQPNRPRPSDGLRVAGEEVAKPQDPPGLRETRALTEAIHQLQIRRDEMQAAIAAESSRTNAALQHVYTYLGESEARADEQFETLQARVETLRLSRLAHDSNIVARLHNSRVARPDVPLQPLLDNRNQAVPGFPRTLADLVSLPNAQLVALMRAYGLPEGPTGEAQRHRLKQFIGVVDSVAELGSTAVLCPFELADGERSRR